MMKRRDFLFKLPFLPSAARAVVAGVAKAVATRTVAPALIRPFVTRISSATGCGLTHATIRGLTPADFESLYARELDLSKIIMNAKEAKMLGMPAPLDALLKSKPNGLS